MSASRRSRPTFQSPAKRRKGKERRLTRRRSRHLDPPKLFVHSPFMPKLRPRLSQLIKVPSHPIHLHLQRQSHTRPTTSPIEKGTRSRRRPTLLLRQQEVLQLSRHNHRLELVTSMIVRRVGLDPERPDEGSEPLLRANVCEDDVSEGDGSKTSPASDGSCGSLKERY